MLTGDSVSVSGNTSERTGVDHQDEDVKTILSLCAFSDDAISLQLNCKFIDCISK